jgi:hypothetical protein
MKNRLRTLLIILLKTWVVFLLGLIAAEVILITLDFLGYDSQVKEIVKYLHL